MMSFDKKDITVIICCAGMGTRLGMPVILGCTELPILYEKYRDNIQGAVYDPLQIALRLLKKEYDYE